MLTVDVVYPLANRSKGRDDWELRYSLRSLAEQDWVRDVYVVGHRPRWARGVRHLPAGDPYANVKDANIINKVLRACREPSLSDLVVVNSDDHYILRKVDLADLGPWLEGPDFLENCARQHRASLWHRRMLHTVDWCRRHGHPTWAFHCHHPYLVNKQQYLDVMRRIPWSEGVGLHSHVYYNVACPNAWFVEPGPSVQTLSHRTPPTEEQMEGARSCAFYNHNDTGLGSVNKAWLERRFPNPSRWEN